MTMTIQQDIDALRAKISKAESDRDTWRAAGREEKYLEAFFMIEAMQLQLDECSRQRGATNHLLRPLPLPERNAL